MVIQPPRPTAEQRLRRDPAPGGPINGPPEGWILPGPSVVVLIGGHSEQGDDGAPLAAAATLLPTIPPAVAARLEIRRRPLLEVEDLAGLPGTVQCLLIDAASGPPAGIVVTGELDDLRDSRTGELGFLLRSMRHDETAALLDGAALLRGTPLTGRFVAISGHRWGFGTGLSPAVRDGLPAFRGAIEAAIRRLAGPLGR